MRRTFQFDVYIDKGAPVESFDLKPIMSNVWR